MELDIRVIVGANIKRIRKSKRMRQLDLANCLNLTSNSITHMELGKQNISLYHLQDIANALGVPVTKLFEGLES